MARHPSQSSCDCVQMDIMQSFYQYTIHGRSLFRVPLIFFTPRLQSSLEEKVSCKFDANFCGAKISSVRIHDVLFFPFRKYTRNQSRKLPQIFSVSLFQIIVQDNFSLRLTSLFTNLLVYLFIYLFMTILISSFIIIQQFPIN